MIKSGLGYTYITSNDASDWKLSSESINSSNSIVGLTLKPFYDAEVTSIYQLEKLYIY